MPIELASIVGPIAPEPPKPMLHAMENTGDAHRGDARCEHVTRCGRIMRCDRVVRARQYAECRVCRWR